MRRIPRSYLRRYQSEPSLQTRRRELKLYLAFAIIRLSTPGARRVTSDSLPRISTQILMSDCGVLHGITPCEQWCTVGPTGRTKPRSSARRLTAIPLETVVAPIHIGSQQPIDLCWISKTRSYRVGLNVVRPGIRGDRCRQISDVSNLARCSFLQAEHASRRNFARNNKLGLLNQNDVAALVYRPAEKNYRAAIGSRARRRDFNDFALNMEYVSGTGRCRPAQLSPAPTKPPASGGPLSTFRRIVIAAVCQPLAAKPLKNVRSAACSSV